MDIKKLLITDDVSEKIVEDLRAANLVVDVASDISAQRITEIIHVSLPLSSAILWLQLC